MTYPNTATVYVNKQDNIDKVVANDVNILYSEMMGVTKELGTDGFSGVAKGMPWGTGTAFSDSTADWTSSGGLKARLQNIESGLYSVIPLAAGIDGGTP